MWVALYKTSCKREVAEWEKALEWFFGIGVVERHHPCPRSLEKPLTVLPHPFQTLGALPMRALCDNSPCNLCFVRGQEGACG